MGRISRRDWLAAGGAMVGAGLMQNGGRAQSVREAGQYEVLEARWTTAVFDGVTARLRSYNGQVPGPMLHARPGETLKIRLKNSLPKTSSAGWNGNHNVPHMFSATNLHMHGLDIAPHLFAPLGTSDPLARMISVESGQSLDYSFQLPADQPPGLYWYHPHHHGSTVIQAVSGMAGGMIVYGNVDEVPEIKAARDIPLVVQDIGLFESEDEPNTWTYNPKQNAMWQTFGGYVFIYDPATGQDVPQPNLKGGFTTGDYKLRFFLLNGKPFFREDHNYAPNLATQPLGKQLPPARITVAPGEVVRFRMLNACSDNLMPVAVEGHDMYLIALDGVNFPAPRVIPALASGTSSSNGQVLLAPANRAEFLIKASTKPGVYRIQQLAQAEQFLFSSPRTIAEIEVSGSAKNMALPTALPTPSRYYPLIQPSEVKRIRNIVFEGMFPPVINPAVGLDFMINGNQYDELAVPHVVQLGTVEEWHIQVMGAHHGGTEGHPFHIHVNHFETISTGGVAAPPGTIQDTVWTPEKSETVIRMKFKQWKGKAVLHCHILPHEDTGMMQNFLIV